MRKMRVYMDTSVFGGYFDQEFEADTQGFFQALSQDKMAALISEALVRELEYAPDFHDDARRDRQDSGGGR